MMNKLYVVIKCYTIEDCDFILNEKQDVVIQRRLLIPVYKVIKINQTK